ncbi:MAG: hypothetical protein WBL61_00410 [Bryobacteraceae bacterium]
MGPITFTLTGVLVALLVMVLMQLFKKPHVSAAPAEDLANLKPSQARAGDVISIAGAGDDMTDLDFTSDRCTWFQAGAHNWFELSGPYKERRVAMRVDSSADQAVSVSTDAKQPTLEDLGLSEEDLAQMDERQNTADTFDFDGKLWLYRMSREVQTTRSDQPQPAGFYCWEYREQNGPGILLVRKEQAEPFAVTRYRGIPAGDVTIYRGSKG